MKPSPELAQWVQISKDIATVIAIIIGGTWTLLKFGINREKYAKIEFNLDLMFLNKVSGQQIIELVAIVQNKGLVRQKIKEWTFDLLFITDNDPVEITDPIINFQVKFKKAISKRGWVPDNWGYTFIDGGTTQQYTYLTIMPENAKLLIINSRFIYPGNIDFHSAQKTFIVPTDTTT